MLVLQFYVLIMRKLCSAFYISCINFLPKNTVQRFLSIHIPFSVNNEPYKIHKLAVHYSFAHIPFLPRVVEHFSRALW